MSTFQNLEIDFNIRENRQKFYVSVEWRNMREYVLANEPFCRKCKVEGYLVAATEVDHIEDIADYPELRLEITNLQPLCKPCHSRKTNKKTGNKAQIAAKAKNKITMVRLWKI